MTTSATDGHLRPTRPQSEQSCGDDSIKASLDVLEEMLDKAGAGRSTGDWMLDSRYVATIVVELRRLHARLRVHHTGSVLAARDDAAASWPPELTEDINRLRTEHPRLLGQLDRLLRSADSMADKPLEDKEVFIMRIRELIAVLRRHEAEEDRLFYFAVWRDTGGES